MALTTIPTTDLVPSNKSKMFEEDDEETWSLLVSLSPASADISPRLRSLAQRLEEDLDKTTPPDFWNGLRRKVQGLGFRYDAETLKTSSSNNNSGGSGNDYPVAFQSEIGKSHIKAVASLLGLSEQRAVKITMSALRSVDSEGTKFQSLLGSRDLLFKTMLHHYHQRSARLSVLTECLRLEQDPDTLQRDAIVQFLNSLDSACQDGGRDRGLYRRLLTVACAPEVAPTRDQLEPCKALQDSSPRSLQDALIAPQGEKGWKSFVGTCLEERRIQTIRERTEAMEALLVLLYERINGGLRRADYALLLTAFKSTSSFFTENTEGKRLSILAGLICAESMTLWRAFAQDATGVWVKEHPLLMDIGSNPAATQEIETLQILIQDTATAALQRQSSSMTNTDIPEALALLAFGLLLHLASTCGLNGLGASGIEMVMSANDTYGIFDYLHAVIHTLTDKASKRSSSIAHDEPYDWQFSDLSKPLLLENQQEKDAGADTVAYTSIAREVLAAAIATFGSKILASIENISMLTNLAYRLYQNNSMLCEQFWSDWEGFSSKDSSTSKFPMCSLMDSAFKLAVGALEALDRDYRTGENFASHCAPFFRLLSSLAHNPTVVETTIAALPKGMIRKALLCCRSEALTAHESYSKSKVILLESFGTLARVGNSEACLDRLRMTLEDEGREHGMVDGPRVLARILSTRSPAQEVKPVLQTMAHLLQGAPQRWVLQLAQEMIVSEDTKNGLSSFLVPGSDSAHAASLILAELMEHFTAVVFCDSFIDESAVTFLHLLENGILSATSMLASSLSAATSSLSGLTPLSFQTAQTILQGFADFLKGLTAVARIHRSERVRLTAVQVRDNLINALATRTSWGHAIAYYAAAPVSLTLLIKLQHVVEDQRILQQVSSEGDNTVSDAASKMGAWQSVLNRQAQGSAGTVTKECLLGFAEKMTLANLDLEGIQARGWTNSSEELAPINAAWSAIRLLSSWAFHVEDIAKTYSERVVFSDSVATNDEAKKLIAALSPQRLLTSLASSPVPCRDSSALSSAWQNAGLSHFDLLLPYLTQGDEGNTPGFTAPTSATLDFLQACIVHVRSSCPSATVADSMLFRAVYRSTRFAKLSKIMLERSIKASTSGSLTLGHKSDVTNGFLLLRITAACVEASASVADKLLHLDMGGLVSELVEAVSRGHKVITSSDGSSNILETEDAVVKLRLATGCLEVLSSIWKTAFRSLQVREDSVRSRLCKVVEEQRALITILVTAVSLFGNGKLESRIVPSWTSEHARCTMTTFISTAMKLLTTELAYSVCSPAVCVNDALKNLLLVDFVQGARFASFEGYRYATATSAMLESTGIQKKLNECQVADVLKCFPSTASSYLLKDFYRNENAFDVSSALRLLVSMGSTDREETEDVMSKAAISYQATLCELQMMASWKDFAESMVILFSGHSDETKHSPNIERMFDLAHATMGALCENVVDIEKSHGDSTQKLMKNECIHMVKLLSQLFLFFLEFCGDGGVDSNLPTSTLLELLSLVIRTSEAVFSLISADVSNGAAPMDSLEACCELQCPLLASAVVILGLIETRPSSSMDPFKNRQDSSYNALCRANGRVLRVLVDLLKKTKQDGDVVFVTPSHRDLLRCCIALATALVARGQGSSLSESGYYNLVAETFQEYEVLPRLLQLGISSSRVSVSSIVKEKYPNSKPSSTVLNHIHVVQEILSLVYSVAETNDRKMLGILPKVLLSQFVVRNPLFSFASTNWTSRDPTSVCKRGYIILNAPRQAPAKGNGSPGQGFHIGVNDPIHDVWLATMKVLQAALQASSCWLSAQSIEESSLVFFDIAIEFLCTHREALLACLKSTGASLTRRVLLEVNYTLALVAELSKRDTRDSFLRSQGDLCEEFASWAKYAVVSISKFLSASGTSRELFLAIEDYESSDSEEITEEMLSGLRMKHRHPLLSEGLSSAKHEAVKYSHYASRLCERVTESDFKEASVVRSRLKKAAQDRGDESDLERACRLSVTCGFAIDMEKTAADCLLQAISLIWRVHPVSFSFQPFSKVEIQNMDAMMIVRPGIVIGFRPRGGDGMLVDYGSRPRLFNSLRFGRVRSSNTIERTWEVSILDRKAEVSAVDELTENVHVRQLAGIEDASMRKAVTAYRPAPTNTAALDGNKGVLSVGDLISVLRWCHQESLSKPGNDQSLDRATNTSVRRVAEQTMALLGAELSMHEEIGSPAGLSKGDRLLLDSQIFELFADETIFSKSGDNENALPVRHNTRGRLQGIVDHVALSAVGPQVAPSVQRAWQEIQEKERRRREKRVFAHDTNWFSSVRRRGSWQKSAFRGLA